MHPVDCNACLLCRPQYWHTGEYIQGAAPSVLLAARWGGGSDEPGGIVRNFVLNGGIPNLPCGVMKRGVGRTAQPYEQSETAAWALALLPVRCCCGVTARCGRGR